MLNVRLNPYAVPPSAFLGNKAILQSYGPPHQGLPFLPQHCHSPSLQLGQHGTKDLQGESGLTGSRKQTRLVSFLILKESFRSLTHFGRAKKDENSNMGVGNK